MILIFEGGRRRFCLDCFFFQSDLAAADVDLMHRLLQQHTPKKMLDNWLGRGQVMCFGPGNRIDSEKARAVRTQA